MDQNIIWFKWDKKEPLVPGRVFKAVTDGGMGLESFRILGTFSFSEGHARIGGLDFGYEGEVLADGAWDVEIAGYDEPGDKIRAIAVVPYVEPPVFNPDA
ncbi:MAG: hypothetical protein IT462_03665 [Planctomycetes bacterium]|nr:hypothetical protein [Planctomycetota bacterium]